MKSNKEEEIPLHWLNRNVIPDHCSLAGLEKKIQTELGEEKKLRRKFIHSWSFLFSFSILFVFLSSAFAAADRHREVFESPKEKNARWSTKESRLSRSTPEERRKRLGSYLPFSTSRERTLAVPSLVLPTSLDWRNYNGSNYFYIVT